MPVDRSELSSLTALLEQLVERVGHMAEHAASAKEDDVANELYGIERQLTGARRRLTRMVTSR